MIGSRIRLSIWIGFLYSGFSISANPTLVAVATNFYGTAESLLSLYQEKSQPSNIKLVSGSTGQLYAQIQNGAPFDIFLAADTRRVDLAIKNGLAVAQSRFTYAVGRLAFVLNDEFKSVPDSWSLLENFDIQRLAIANAKVAPYGFAAEEVLERLGYDSNTNTTLLRAENISQAYTMVSTGNASAGLLAYAHILSSKHPANLIHLIPEHMHSPIRQDAILLTRGKDNTTANAFLQYLKSVEARAFISENGYSIH